MLSDPLTLKDNAGTDVSYVVTSTIPATSQGTGTIRVDSASSASEPRTLTIKQSITGKGKSRVRRTLLQIQQTKLDTAGNPVLQTNNLSWTFQLDGTYVAADLYHNLCQLADLVLTTGSLAVDATKGAALLQGQS